jgi:hypothetical protein
MFDTPTRQLVSALDRQSPTEIAAALSACAPILGPAAPLPALFEEITRRRLGLSVRSARLAAADKILSDQARLAPLVTVLADLTLPTDTRTLAGVLLAGQHTLDGPVIDDDVPCALATTFRPEGIVWRAMVDASLDRYLPGDLPHPLVVLALLAGLHDGTLDEDAFSRLVLLGGALHPEVSRHRPLHRLHRLLDYLGFSDDPRTVLLYRALAGRVWPHATAENWSQWGWVALPAGADLFPQAATALAEGRVTLPGLHALKYALPSPISDNAVAMLVCWLRGNADGVPAEIVAWLMSANTSAAGVAYAAPSWWSEWLTTWYPAAQQAMAWLQAVALPPGAERHDWLERYLVPHYRAITANLLLAHAATSGPDALLPLAARGHLPAVRALGMAAPSETLVATLQTVGKDGGRPAQAAALSALDHLARRAGLPDAREFARQQLLALAWEESPLDDAGVRVGWEAHGCRIRLALRHGTVTLEVLDVAGPLPRVPDDVRRSPAYREARAVQKEAQARYRAFRSHLERAFLEGMPVSTGQFRHLLENPIFAHLAERLLWRTPDGRDLLWAGPGRWETLDGTAVEPSAALTLTLPHPVLLARDGTLAAWQLLAAERRLVQPFKQLFREVYLAEGETGTACTRFAGRRILPGPAYALLKSAGYAPGSGTARRDWSGGVTAHLCWAEGITGRDLFGSTRRAEVTIGAITFTRDGAPLPLHRVDPIVFSETLRAADLLTTRAAAGDADLTSRETLALRATLLRQVARSFQMTNIAVGDDGRYAVVLGDRATYRVNLASGTVLLEPEGRQVVLPPADPRWMPAEDRDATADILATILTLAHDADIADLTFLAQL